jgi:hypothetical protein
MLNSQKNDINNPKNENTKKIKKNIEDKYYMQIAKE